MFSLQGQKNVVCFYKKKYQQKGCRKIYWRTKLLNCCLKLSTLEKPIWIIDASIVFLPTWKFETWNCVFVTTVVIWENLFRSNPFSSCLTESMGKHFLWTFSSFQWHSMKLLLHPNLPLNCQVETLEFQCVVKRRSILSWKEIISSHVQHVVKKRLYNFILPFNNPNVTCNQCRVIV